VETNCSIFIVEKMDFFDFVWTWTLHEKFFWSMVGLGLSIKNSQLDLDCKIDSPLFPVCKT